MSNPNWLPHDALLSGRQVSAPPIQFPLTSRLVRPTRRNIRSTSRQTRICEFLRIHCQHKPSLLDLPSCIRRRIYSHANLALHHELYFDLTIDCGWVATYRYDYYTLKLEDRPQDVDLQATRSLLLACRSTYADVAALIYSRNKICFRYRQDRELTRFSRLSTISLASLRYLMVVLHSSETCARSSSCCIDGPDMLGTNQVLDKPQDAFVAGSPRFQEALSQWEQLVDCITIYANTTLLSLEFICDTKGSQTASQAVAPLWKIQKLQHCAIRLSAERESWAKQLAKQSVERLTRPPIADNRPAFRFMDLPAELRHQILTFTDLVTPFAEVFWTIEKGYHIIRYRPTMVSDSMTREEYAQYHQAPSRLCWHENDLACFCSSCHGAYASVHHCWEPPISIFLTSRCILHQAREVFFARNRFVVLPSLTPHKAVTLAPPRLEPSIFLTEIVPRSELSRIKFLEFVFPQFDAGYFQNSEATLQDWDRTLAYAKDYLNIPLLTLRVYLSDFYQDSVASGDLIKNFDGVCEAYADLLRPLAKLKKMKWFFADISWPLPQAYDREELEKQRWHKTQLDQMVEKEWVMGLDYDTTGCRTLVPFSERIFHRSPTYQWSRYFLESGWFRLVCDEKTYQRFY